MCLCGVVSSNSMYCGVGQGHNSKFSAWLMEMRMMGTVDGDGEFDDDGG